MVPETVNTAWLAVDPKCFLRVTIRAQGAILTAWALRDHPDSAGLDAVCCAWNLSLIRLARDAVVVASNNFGLIEPAVIEYPRF